MKIIGLRIILPLLFVCSFLFSRAQILDSLHTDSLINEATGILPAKDTLKLRFVAVGDIMLGTNYPETYYLPPYDGKFLLDSVKTYLRESTLSFGNMEGTYSNGKGPTSKRCNDPKKCYAFRSPEHYLGYVADAGFDILSLANNHSGDFGMEARLRTMELADSLGMKYAGLESCPFTLFEKEGIRYGFTAFAPNSGCNQLNDLDNAIAIMDHLDSLCDIIIVSFHGGAEGSKYQHVAAGRENYLGENRGDLRLFTHTLIDHGADMIFGHGPHVTRGMELYKNRIIAYSLGNFATYERFNLSGPNGYAPILIVETDLQGKFLGGNIIPIRQIGEGIPMPDTDKNVIRIIQDLSKTDFPNTYPQISDEGQIIPR